MDTLHDMLATTWQNLRDSRLPHIHSVINYVERIPYFTRKIGKTQTSKLESIWLAFVTSLFIIFKLFTLSEWSQVSDLHSFIVVIDKCTGLATIACYFWYIWRNTEDTVTIKDMERFDTRFRIEYGDTTDAFVFLWMICLVIAWCLRYMTLLYMKSPIVQLVTATAYIMLNVQVSQMFLLKYLIIKRFKVIIKRMDDQDVFQVLPSIRSLLEMNTKINDFYSPILFFWSLFYFANLVMLSASLWYYIVLEHRDLNFYPKLPVVGFMIASILSHHFIMYWFTSVSDQVDAIIHEMDRSVSDCPYESSQPLDAPGPSTACPELRLKVKPIEELRKIVSLMQELSETPTEPTALDLFSLCPASLTFALGLFIDIGLVLMQFL